jgi:ABC-type multidrug transport system fused ATPase/permease subunit
LTKGIEVSDLWAAHSGKRAWACRDINITCKAGEVVVVLGEESSGKTKLLTTVAEMVVSPPQIAKTTNVARGKVSIGGVNVQNWNQKQLRGKVGIFLNDAKTLDCMSQLHSRQMLKEILRPETPSGTNNRAVDSAVQIANQFTGMSNMIAKLPEKLETRITCNEEDLSLDPKLILLSSCEWSKVLLTKLLAQIVMSNDNPMSSPSSLSKSLVGSILLLDDVTINLDEITEAKLLKSLKNAGVATIMTSKRWSVGRYASRIIVMKDGSIIESGTHSELMAKGADNSMYADQWTKLMST